MVISDFITISISFLSVIIAGLATLQARTAALAAKQQVEQQRLDYESAQQPYVWADIRPSSIDGQMLQLVVGNSGPTVASNVIIRINPWPDHVERHHQLLIEALERFNKGHASIAPGRELRWNLGVGHELLAGTSKDRLCRVVINASGPFGPVEELSYALDMNDWRGSTGGALGSLWRVEKALDRLTIATAKPRRTEDEDI
ncbi:hypothetical protein [Citricoccus sp. NR2]|uniref:hypothetical protein n=1 Tax=Citricoccus sp. NR2 TaxID=3004095 RepID=UPI0022DE2E58|nr:hypothetical protein [Citricoccus sp. NR2]WBL19209.1 hypothetical protein O1A05_00430 [Citricoccus sp. NR2]